MLAFWWKLAFREAFQISAVVVHHELLLHPPQPVPPGGVQPLILPRGVLKATGVVGIAAGLSGGPHTGVGLKVSVGSSERSFGPVSLDKATSGSPIVRVPQA